MKHFIAFTFALLTWQNAFAMFDMNATDRPVSSANMSVVAATGIYQGLENVRLEKWSQNLNGFFADAAEMNQHRYTYKLTVNDTTLQLGIEDVTTDECGSQIVVLKDMESAGPSIPTSASFTMTLTDHSHRVCEDYKAYQWELSVVYKDSLSSQDNGKLLVMGNPEAVYSIMAQ